MVFLCVGAWHSCNCGQTVRWIKMPLGKEVGLGPGHIVLDDDPVGTQHRHSSPSPLFGPCLLWPNGRPSQQLLSSFCINGRPKMAAVVTLLFINLNCILSTLICCGILCSKILSITFVAWKTPKSHRIWYGPESSYCAYPNSKLTLKRW